MVLYRFSEGLGVGGYTVCSRRSTRMDSLSDSAFLGMVDIDKNGWGVTGKSGLKGFMKWGGEEDEMSVEIVSIANSCLLKTLYRY